MCFESSVSCEYFRSLKESDLVVVVSCFEFVLCHTNVGPCVTRGCCDSCFVNNVLGKARTVKRAKVFASTAELVTKCRHENKFFVATNKRKRPSNRS